MKVDDEMLMALADGELDRETAERLKRMIAADPALQADYALFAQTAAALRADPGLGPVPERLIRQIRETQPAPTVAEPKARLSLVLGWRPVALAASVVLAFFAGQSLAPAPDRFSAMDYALLPSGETRALPGGGELRAMASYETADGLCRHLKRTSAEESEDLLLCQGDEGWGLRLALRGPATAGGFVPASTLAAEALAVALDELEAAEALPPEAEKARLSASRN